jgi:hypothetical protein
MALPVNWVDNVGMHADAAYLNALGGDVNANTAALGGKKLWAGTAAAYAAIVTKDANTVYVVTA